MKVEPKLHIPSLTVPEMIETYCGRYLTKNRESRVVEDWDDATCLICIRVAEFEKPGWKHPSHRS